MTNVTQNRMQMGIPAKRESTPDPLEEVFKRFSSEISILRQFIGTMDRVIEKKLPKPGQAKLSAADKKECDAFMAFLLSATEGKSTKTNYKIRSPKLGKLIMSLVVPTKQRSLLMEMVLIYAAAQFEGFLKDSLKAAFVLKPECMKSNRQLSYDEVLSQPSMEALLRHLAQREADDLGRGSIDSIDTYYQKKFNIPLSAYSNWNTVREGSYRRNLFVHNGGITNEIYCKAVGYKTVGKHMSTDLDYIKNLLKHFRGISRYTHTRLRKKVRSSTL